MQLTVIMPCRNAAETIGAQLDLLAAEKWSEPWEVIVCDNGSTDETLQIVRAYDGRIPNLRIVDASDKVGSPHARNVGVKAARSESIAFCDADDEIGPGWVSAMGEALLRFGAVVCKQDDEKLNEPWLRESRQNNFQDGVPRIWYPPYYAYASSGAMGLKRSLHEAIGGFDESMIWISDADYSFRLQRLGVEFHFLPNALVYYRYRKSFKGIFRQAYDYGFGNARLQKSWRELDLTMRDRLKWPFRGSKAIIAALPFAHRKWARARLAWLLGWQAGRVHGSIAYRILAF